MSQHGPVICLGKSFNNATTYLMCTTEHYRKLVTLWLAHFTDNTKRDLKHLERLISPHVRVLFSPRFCCEHFTKLTDDKAKQAEAYVANRLRLMQNLTEGKPADQISGKAEFIADALRSDIRYVHIGYQLALLMPIRNLKVQLQKRSYDVATPATLSNDVNFGVTKDSQFANYIEVEDDDEKPPAKKRRTEYAEKSARDSNKKTATSRSLVLVNKKAQQLSSGDSEQACAPDTNEISPAGGDNSLSSHLTKCVPDDTLQQGSPQSQDSGKMQLEPSQLDEKLMFVPQNAIERSWMRYSKKLTANGMDINAYQDCLMPIFDNYVSFWNFSVNANNFSNTLQSGTFLVFVDLLKNPHISMPDITSKLNGDIPLLGNRAIKYGTLLIISKFCTMPHVLFRALLPPNNLQSMDNAAQFTHLIWIKV